MKIGQEYRPKVVLFHNIFSPHVTPIFEELAKNVDLTVLYCAEREANRKWKEKAVNFQYKILPNWSVKLQGKDLFTYFVNKDVIKEIKESKPDVVIISGWDIFAYQAAFFYCKMVGIKIIIWSGSTENEKSWRRTISLPLVKLMVAGADAYIAYGTRARQYLISLGSDPKKIFISFNTTNLKLYSPQKKVHKKKIVIMYYGQLIERKGVDLLIKAVAGLQESYKDISLLLVGDGQNKEMYKKSVNDLNLRNVEFVADPGDEGIGKYFTQADIFVLPSREEVWGLVVNEAMAFGLPVVVSDVCGSSTDLIKNGENGYIFKNGDVQDLTQKLERLVKSQSVRSKFARKSLEIIKDFTADKTVFGTLLAIDCVLEGNRVPDGTFISADSKATLKRLMRSGFPSKTQPTTKLEKYKYKKQSIFLKREDLNPTSSFKYRAAKFMIEDAAKKGYEKAFVLTSGNAGLALVNSADRFKIKSKIFTDSETKTKQLAKYGAYVTDRFPKKNMIDQALELIFSVIHQWDNAWMRKYGDFFKFQIAKGYYAAQPSIFINAQSLISYALISQQTYEQLGGRPPKTVIVPVINSDGALGQWLGYYYLWRDGLIDQIPKFILVEKQKRIPHFNYPQAWEIAKGISAIEVVSVITDEEIQSQHDLITHGIKVEQVSAGCLKVLDKVSVLDPVVVIITGGNA